MTLFQRAVLSTFAAAAVAFAAPAFAQEASHSITIRDHNFEPSTLDVKAGVKIKLTVINAQKQAAEFESAELNREKVIPPGQSVIIYVGPLAPGMITSVTSKLNTEPCRSNSGRRPSARMSMLKNVNSLP